MPTPPTWIHLLAHPADAALEILGARVALPLNEQEYTSCGRRLRRLLDQRLPSLRQQDRWLERALRRLRGAISTNPRDYPATTLADQLYQLGLR
ncbi:MAG: hypothetical protein EA401_13195 [Planctomycetota bacterium]|nr:MAG: hypothetical protein EA401_13195 [Planctomycetota bacterium]